MTISIDIWAKTWDTLFHSQKNHQKSDACLGNTFSSHENAISFQGSWGICIHSCWLTSVPKIPSCPKYPSKFIADLHPIFIYEFIMYRHTPMMCANIIHVQYVIVSNCPMFNPSPEALASRSASHRSPAANWAAECWAQADQGRSPGRGHGQTWQIWKRWMEPLDMVSKWNLE